MATTHERRPSVIMWAGKEVIAGTAGHNIQSAVHKPSLQTRDVRYHAKLCDLKHNKDQVPRSDRKIAQTVPMCAKTDIYQQSSKNNKECKYNCRFCGKSFQWYSHWLAHERIHTREKPFKCDECDKAFTRADGLRCHKLTHLNHKTSHFPLEKIKRPYEQLVGTVNVEDVFAPAEIIKINDKELSKCRLCNRVLLSSTGFLKHVQRHKTSKYVFICDTCGKAFTKQSALEIHNRAHTGVRPYHCNTCSKAFSIYGNMKRHLLIHTGEKPYMCSTCSRSFNNPSHLTRHIKNKHIVSNANT